MKKIFLLAFLLLTTAGLFAQQRNEVFRKSERDSIYRMITDSAQTGVTGDNVTIEKSGNVFSFSDPLRYTGDFQLRTHALTPEDTSVHYYSDIFVDRTFMTKDTVKRMGIGSFQMFLSGVGSFNDKEDISSLQSITYDNRVNATNTDPYSSSVNAFYGLYGSTRTTAITNKIERVNIFRADIWNTGTQTHTVKNLSAFNFQPDYWTRFTPRFTVDTVRVFYSQMPSYLMGNWFSGSSVYHFYGEGNFPSYFGGNVEIDGTLNAGSVDFSSSSSVDLGNSRVTWDNLTQAVKDTFDAKDRGIVYPEDYDAVGDGTTNDATALTNAINAAKGKKLVLTQTYKVTSNITIDLDEADIEIEFKGDASITSSFASSNTTYGSPTGSITLQNGGRVIVKNGHIRNTNNSGATLATVKYHDALLFIDCDDVIVENMTIENASHAGIQSIDNNKFTAKGNTIDSCHYAGIIMRGTKQYLVDNNLITYTGVKNHFYDFGYAITASGRYEAYSSEDNENGIIRNNKCYYSAAKGIDSHGSLGLTIDGNFIKGYGGNGIYAVNEDGNNVYDKIVRDVKIINNTVEQDSAWFASKIAHIPAAYTSGYSVNGIMLGSYNANVQESGSFLLENNFIINSNVPHQRAPIFIWQPNAGEIASHSIKVKNNTVTNVRMDTSSSLAWNGAEVYNNSDGVIYLAAASSPKFVDIVGNTFESYVAKWGVRISGGELIDISNNKFYGSYYGSRLKIQDSLAFKTRGNLYAVLSDTFYNTFESYNLIDYDSKGTGKWDYTITTSNEANVEIPTIKVDPDYFLDGSTTVDLEILIAGSGAAPFHGKYRFTGYIGSSSPSTYRSDINITEEEAIYAESLLASYRPTVAWITTSGNEKLLKITTAQPYTGYDVKLRFTSWRLKVEEGF